MIRFRFRIAALLPSIALAAACTTGANEASSPVERVAEERMSEFLDTSAAQAISVAIVYEGKSYTLHQGTLALDGAEPPSDDRFFEIASVTKTFTGTIAAQAVLDGKLDLDDDIRQYLDGDYPNLEFADQPIQLRHLLTHTSGLPSNTKGMSEALKAFAPANGNGANWRMIYEANERETRETFLDYLDEVELTAKPGTIFNYSNYGTNLTAHILERVYQQSYEQLLEEYVFRPAGMEEAALRLDASDEYRRVLGTNQADENIPRLTIADVLWGADGGVKATVVDMANYLKWQLDGRAPAILESRTRLDQRDIGYWLGYFWWVIDTETGARSYRHDGGGAGVRNVMIVYPDDNLAIYAVTNKSTSTMNDEMTSMVRSIRSDLIELRTVRSDLQGASYSLSKNSAAPPFPTFGQGSTGCSALSPFSTFCVVCIRSPILSLHLAPCRM